MNTLIANPKAKLLLGAALDVLHHESKDWLEAIAFWKEEIVFFDKLLYLQDPLKKEEHIYRDMLQQLEDIEVDIISQTEEDIIAHEKSLAKLMRKEEGLADADYRDKHRQLKLRMATITNDIKAFKLVVFNFVKKLKA